MKRLPQTLLFLALLVLAASGCCVDRQQTGNRAFNGQGPAVAQDTPRAQQPKGKVDLTRAPLDRIPVGTVIGKTAPEGWSNLVLFATPTLTAEDLRDAPQMATHYAQLFKFVVLANVARHKEGGEAPFYLDKVARGFATPVGGKEMVISSQDTRGATLGLFGKRILDENENVLDNDVQRVARTDTMLLFDAKSVMLRGKEHTTMIMRHALLVDPRSGRLYTLVWLLTNDYEPAEPDLQLLPDAMQEKRLLSVKRDRFTLGIPSRDAFALRRVPQGTAIPYTPELREAASIRAFQEAQVPKMEETLRAAAMKAAPK